MADFVLVALNETLFDPAERPKPNVRLRGFLIDALGTLRDEKAPSDETMTPSSRRVKLALGWLWLELHKK